MAEFEGVLGSSGVLLGFSDMADFAGVFGSLLQLTGTEIVFFGELPIIFHSKYFSACFKTA